MEQACSCFEPGCDAKGDTHRGKVVLPGQGGLDPSEREKPRAGNPVTALLFFFICIFSCVYTNGNPATMVQLLVFSRAMVQN